MSGRSGKHGDEAARVLRSALGLLEQTQLDEAERQAQARLAVRLCSTALRLVPHSCRQQQRAAHVARALALAKLRFFEEALKDCDTLDTIDKDDKELEEDTLFKVRFRCHGWQK